MSPTAMRALERIREGAASEIPPMEGSSGAPETKAPSAKAVAGKRFAQALESKDGDAIASAFSELMEMCGPGADDESGVYDAESGEMEGE